MSFLSKTRKPVTYISIFVAGMVCGLIVYNYSFSQSMDIYRDTIREYLETEEEFRARREERNGNLDGAIYHQRNSILFSSPHYTKAFSEPFYDNKDILLQPFVYLLLGKVIDANGPMDEARQEVESIKRGYLAYLLEKNGLTKQARVEWKTATSLSQYTEMEKVQARTYSFVENIDKDIQIQAENALLGDQ